MARLPRSRSTFLPRVLLAFVALTLVVTGNVAAQCTSDDLASKNAEKCAKKYAAALKKCLKKKIPLAVCDTSKSNKFCSRLSAGCMPKLDIDEVIRAIYGDNPTLTDDKCVRKLRNQALNVVEKRLKRARAGKGEKLEEDVATCISKGTKAPKKCVGAPSLRPPCDAVATANEAAACVCNLGCRELAAEELAARAAGERWGDEFNHAIALGYTDVGNGVLCERMPEGRTLFVSFRDPTALPPNNAMVLTYAARDGFSFLVRSDGGGGTSIFNTAGGVHIAADGAVTTVGPDGLGAISEPHGRGNVDCASLSCEEVLLDQFQCGVQALADARTALSGAQCTGSAAAVQVAVVACALQPLFCPSVAPTGGYFLLACGDFLLSLATAPVVDAAIGCDRCGSQACFEDFPCAFPDGVCSWGRCKPLVPDPMKMSCNPGGFPRCVTTGQPDGIQSFECEGVRCGLRPFISCPTHDHVCIGTPPDVQCVLATPTPTPTVTPTPSLCQSDLDCNPGATGQANDPDADCFWRICTPNWEFGETDADGCRIGSAALEGVGSGCDDGVDCSVGDSCRSDGRCDGLEDSTLCNDAPRDNDPDDDCAWNVCCPVCPTAGPDGCRTDGGTNELVGSPCKDGNPCTTDNVCTQGDFNVFCGGGTLVPNCP